MIAQNNLLDFFVLGNSFFSMISWGIFHRFLHTRHIHVARSFMGSSQRGGACLLKDSSGCVWILLAIVVKLVRIYSHCNPLE